jgi:hypothetical protein
MSETALIPQRIEDAISWYDSAAGRNRKTFYVFKILQIGLAAAIPIASTTLEATPAKNFGAVAGSTIAAIEAIQQLFQFQTLYIKYRSTCEAIKAQKSLFLESAGDYMNSQHPRVLLVEKVETMISQENNAWLALKEQSPVKKT